MRTDSARNENVDQLARRLLSRNRALSAETARVAADFDWERHRTVRAALMLGVGAVDKLPPDAEAAIKVALEIGIRRLPRISRVAAIRAGEVGMAPRGFSSTASSLLRETPSRFSARGLWSLLLDRGRSLAQ